MVIWDTGRKMGNYFLPSKDFSAEELREILNDNPKFELIWIYDKEENNSICAEFGFTTSLTREITVLDLEKTEDQLWRELARKRRSGIRKARKNGVTIALATMEEMDVVKTLWIEGYCAKHNKEPGTYLTSIEEKIAARMLFVAHMNGKIIAGSWIRSTREEEEIAIWSSHSTLQEFRKYNPGELLLWEIAMHLKTNGFKKFNLTGGSKFKDQFSVSEKVRVCEWTKNGSE